MKNLILTMLFCIVCGAVLARGKPKNETMLSGTWNYSNATKTVDFIESRIFPIAAKEQFVFTTEKNFEHIFLDENNKIFKKFSGKYQIKDGKLFVVYNDIDYSFNTVYFFIGEDLVLGSPMSHLIFSKETTENLTYNK